MPTRTSPSRRSNSTEWRAGTAGRHHRARFVRKAPESEDSMPDTIHLTPRQIVAELDRNIVGQDEAKRAVAVALRSRWRRQQLGEDLRQEVTPKNILMIGPTGVGKTEISRRLAKLAEAPFIKVEATKF